MSAVAIFSLFMLVAIVAAGFFFNINLGILGLAAASVIGGIAGLGAKEIIAGFPSQLFVLLSGVAYLFTILRVNGTLQAVAEHITWHFRSFPRLLLPVFVLLTFVLAAVGPGNIAVCAIILPIALAVMVAPGGSPQWEICALIIASNMGGLSPLAPTGLIAVELADSIGVELGFAAFSYNISYNLPLLLIYSFIVSRRFKGVKKQGLKPPRRLEKSHIISLGILGVVIVAVLAGGLHIGLTSLLFAVVLLFFTKVAEKDVMQALPWGTLIMISGMAVYTHVLSIVGAIDLLSEFLALFMNSFTAKPILSIIAGLFSLVSSASGVVIPTLFPAVPQLAQAVGKTTVEALLSAVVVGSHAVTVSPMSTLGAIALTSLPESAGRKGLFGRLLILALINLLFTALLMLLSSLL